MDLNTNLSIKLLKATIFYSLKPELYLFKTELKLQFYNFLIQKNNYSL